MQHINSLDGLASWNAHLKWAAIALKDNMTTAIFANPQASVRRHRFNLFNAPITRIVAHGGDGFVLFTHLGSIAQNIDDGRCGLVVVDLQHYLKTGDINGTAKIV